MDRHTRLTTKFRCEALLGVVVLCASGGCWQEIEYTGPDPTGTKRRPAISAVPADTLNVENGQLPPATADTASPAETEANGFGEDLASSLSEPAASSPAGNDVSAAPPLAGERYASLPSEGALGEQDAVNPLPDDPDRAALGTLTATNIEALRPAEDTNSTAAIERADHGASEENSTAAATADEPDSPRANTRLAAWLLGSRLSLAALANDRGIAADHVQQWLADSKALAASLGTNVADLPETAAADGASTASRPVLNYLFVQGQRVGRDLSGRHGADHSALLEVAMKSNLLLVMYEPGASTTDAISAAIAQAAPRARLPAELWQPLLDTLAAKTEPAEVRKAVRDLHSGIERFLADVVER